MSVSCVTQTRCMYLMDGVTKKLRCENSAIARNDYWAWCQLHGGHHESIERLVDGNWVERGDQIWDGEKWAGPCAAGEPQQ